MVVVLSYPASSVTGRLRAAGKRTETFGVVVKLWEFCTVTVNVCVPALAPLAVKPPFASATTVIPVAVTGSAVLTVRGRFAASLQPAKMPGGLTAKYVAMVDGNEVAVQVMPLPTTLDAATVTNAVTPEEQTPPVTGP